MPDVSREDLRYLLYLAECAIGDPTVSHVEHADEVETLRRLAVLAGVDPMTVTPGSFSSRYPHLFKHNVLDTGSTYCRRCGEQRDHQVHAVTP